MTFCVICVYEIVTTENNVTEIIQKDWRVKNTWDRGNCAEKLISLTSSCAGRCTNCYMTRRRWTKQRVHECEVEKWVQPHENLPLIANVVSFDVQFTALVVYLSNGYKTNFIDTYKKKTHSESQNTSYGWTEVTVNTVTSHHGLH